MRSNIRSHECKAVGWFCDTLIAHLWIADESPVLCGHVSLHGPQFAVGPTFLTFSSIVKVSQASSCTESQWSTHGKALRVLNIIRFGYIHPNPLGIWQLGVRISVISLMGDIS